MCGQASHRRHTPVTLRSENHFSVTSISQQRQKETMVKSTLKAYTIDFHYVIY